MTLHIFVPIYAKSALVANLTSLPSRLTPLFDCFSSKRIVCRDCDAEGLHYRSLFRSTIDLPFSFAPKTILRATDDLACRHQFSGEHGSGAVQHRQGCRNFETEPAR